MLFLIASSENSNHFLRLQLSLSGLCISNNNKDQEIVNDSQWRQEIVNNSGSYLQAGYTPAHSPTAVLNLQGWQIKCSKSLFLSPEWSGIIHNTHILQNCSAIKWIICNLISYSNKPKVFSFSWNGTHHRRYMLAWAATQEILPGMWSPLVITEWSSTWSLTVGFSCGQCNWLPTAGKILNSPPE